jgi:hypothetical protein
MKAMHILGAVAVAATLAGSSLGANALTVTNLGQIAPADFGSTESPTTLTGNTVVRLGDAESGAGWDPYGQNNPPDTTHYWVDIPTTTSPVSSATYDVTGTSFEFIWGSPNPGNIVTFYNGASSVADVTTSDLTGFSNTTAPGYLVDITGVPAFTSVVLSQGPGDGGNFELSLAAGAVPETSTWLMMMVGFSGLGFAGYRTSRKSVAFAA